MFFVVVAWDKPGSPALRAETKLRHKAHLDAAIQGRFTRSDRLD